MSKRFDNKIMDEDGFVVEFSNRGTMPKKVFYRYRNPKRKLIACAVPGCHIKTRTYSGVCPSHRKEHEWMVHSVDWIARIIPPGGTRRAYLTNAPRFGDLTESLWGWAKGNKENIDRVTGFFFDCMKQVPGRIPDATSLQSSHEGKVKDTLTPKSIVSLTKTIVERHFPKKEFHHIQTKNINIVRDRGEDIPIRLTSLLLLLGYICEESNRGDLWYKKRIKRSSESQYAGCYMAAGYFLYLRYTDATPQQARMALKG